MTARRHRPFLPLVLVLAAAAAALNVSGAIELGRIADFGYTRVGDSVQQVVAGGPADRAGFRDGDVLVAIEGVAIADAPALARLPRPEIGDRRHYRLARGGDPIDAILLPAALPAAQLLGGRVNAMVGLAFLAVGLLAYLRVGGRLGGVLAGLGLSVAVVMATPPVRLVSAPLVPAVLWAWSVLGVLATACFLEFAVLFPAARRVAAARWLSLAIYAPVAVLAIGLWSRLPIPAFWLQVPYLLLAVGLLLGALRASRDAASRRALIRFLWLTAAALLPFLTVGILSATGVVSNPLVSQLGSWALLLVPVAIASAVLGSSAGLPAAARDQPAS